MVGGDTWYVVEDPPGSQVRVDEFCDGPDGTAARRDLACFVFRVVAKRLEERMSGRG
jgi:hypothetical protein